jgi:uncharacterized protein (DUF1330 family)
VVSQITMPPLADARRAIGRNIVKTHYTVALSMVAGVAIGAAAINGLHAQAKPPAYVLVDVAVSNEDGYQKAFKEYGDKIAKVITDGGGKFLVRGGKIVAIEGAPARRLVIVAFDDLDKAQATFTSAAYKQTRKPGDQYATFRILAVEGMSK